MNPSDIILETRDLTKEFKGFVAVSKVNLQVKRGSIHALIGPNGAGTATSRCNETASSCQRPESSAGER